MKTSRPFSFLAAAALAAGLAAPASAGFFSDRYDMTVVAERAPEGLQRPTPDSPVTYVAFNGGYIEGGDGVAGDEPPAPDVIAQAVNSALQSHGYAYAPASPQLVLTYHFGALRIDHQQARMPYVVRPNLIARVRLVSNQTLGDQVINHLIARRKGTGLSDSAAAPKFLVGPDQTVLERARQSRFFVIVSAFDYQALLHREARLVWRAKMSTKDTNGLMADVFPALIDGGAPYFGEALADVQTIQAPQTAQHPVSAAPELNPAPAAYGLDAAFIANLLGTQGAEFDGSKTADPAD